MYVISEYIYHQRQNTAENNLEDTNMQRLHITPGYSQL